MKAMKRSAPWTELLVLGSGLMGLGAWASGSSTPAAQPLPTPFPEARYERMSARSPFAVATAAAAPAATPGFAAQLFVDGVAHVGSADFVAIKSRDPEKSVIFLAVGESTDDGMKIDAVQWSPQLGKSTVDVSKGGEKATLEFDEAALAGDPDAAFAPRVGVATVPRIPGSNGPLNLKAQAARQYSLLHAYHPSSNLPRQ